MTTSIYGYVEVKQFDDGFDDWFMVIDSNSIVHGNYDFMGCLFGGRNPSNFQPLFLDRGLPNDCSDEIVSYFNESEYKNPTWCSYEELLNIDLSEKALSPDQRITVISNGHKCKRYPQNDEEKEMSKIMTRREALNESGFILLMDLMEVLAKYYGNNAVRWVVFFD